MQKKDGGQCHRIVLQRHQERSSNTCPRCGRIGRTVTPTTVGAMAETRVESLKLSAAEYRICRTIDCAVVYFAPGIEIEKSELRVPVNFKERNYEGSVCYCFNHTVASIRAEIQSSGRSTAQAMITKEIKAGRCACKLKNPAGSCCLGDVTRAIQAVRAQLKGKTDSKSGPSKEAGA